MRPARWSGEDCNFAWDPSVFSQGLAVLLPFTALLLVVAR
jgi:hypothetical protein